MKRIRTRKHQQGFTIIELMIATTVLSVILVLVTFMMISIGKLYYKGISQAKAQQTARAIVGDITDHLELNDQNPEWPTATDEIPVPTTSLKIKAYCIGETRYSYVEGRQIGGGTNQIPHVLWRDQNPDDECKPADLNDPNLSTTSPTGTELMADRGWLAAFSISDTSPYRVEILVALGEQELFDGAGIDTLCMNQAGSEFCATSKLVTSVTKRLTGE